MITNVWYIVENGGDGSVYVKFVESKELAELMGSWDDERYEEDIGCLPIEHEGSLTIKKMKTIDDVIRDASEDIDEDWWEDEDQEKLDALLALKKEKGTSNVNNEDDGYC